MVYHSVVASRPQAHNCACVIVVMHATELSEIMSLELQICSSCFQQFTPLTMSQGKTEPYINIYYVMLNIARALQ